MKRKLSAVAVVLLGCLLWTAWGCGGTNRLAVKGKVSIDGAPLPEGSIDFVAVDKNVGSTAGARIDKGEYVIRAEQGLLPGEYQVQIRAVRSTGKKVWDGMGDDRAPASKKNMVDQMESYVPARYNDRTELRAKIESGKVNAYDYDLQLDKKGR
jgi:hypothetical protein